MKAQSEVIKKSISLSKVVSDWADELSLAKGFETNFSAYIADLIRRDKENQIKLAASGVLKDGSSLKELAEEEIVQAVRMVARKGRRVPKKR